MLAVYYCVAFHALIEVKLISFLGAMGYTHNPLTESSFISLFHSRHLIPITNNGNTTFGITGRQN